MSGQEAQTESAQQNGSAQTPSRSPSCYNCGANDHFMMACPEPTRAIPAGLEAARAADAARAAVGQGNASQVTYNNRGPKRQKTFGGPVVTRYPAPKGGPVVTRYGPPPVTYGGNQPYPSYGAYAPPSQPYYQGQPPPHQPGYGQYSQYPHHQTALPYAQSNGPFPVHTAAPYGQQAPYHYGPQAGAVPQFQHGYQQPYGSPGSVYPPQQHGQYSPANTPSYNQPRAPYGPPANIYPQPSPVPYPHQPPNHAGVMHQNSVAQYSQQPPVPASHQASFAPPAQASPTASYPPQASQASPTQPLSVTNRNSRSSSVSSALQVPGSSSQSLDQDDDAEFNWLLERAFREPKYRPADPIRTSLPSEFDDDHILPPSYDSPGVICKYAKPDNLEEYCRGIKNEEAWKIMNDDPAFLEIDRSAPFILFEDLSAWAQELRNREQSQDVLQDNEDNEHHMSAASHKRIWSEEDHPPEEPRKRHVSSNQYNSPNNRFEQTSYYRTRSEDNENHRFSPEAYTAMNTEGPAPSSFNRSITPAFEMSGTPCSDTADNVWAPEPGEGASPLSTADPTEAFLASLGVSGAPKPVTKKSASFNSPNVPDSHNLDDSRKANRQDSGYGSARGSYSIGGGWSGSHDDHRNHKLENRPPPPPPPTYLCRQTDGSVDSPASSDSGRDAGRKQGFGNGAHDKNPQQYQGDGTSSPLSPTSAELLGFGQSQSQYDARHRQSEGNLRNRRRQPRVADAYSRRW